MQTPGPGHYGLPRTDMYKTKAPGYTIIGRRSESSASDYTPGPDAHCPYMVSNQFVTILRSLLALTFCC